MSSIWSLLLLFTSVASQRRVGAAYRPFEADVKQTARVLRDDQLRVFRKRVQGGAYGHAAQTSAKLADDVNYYFNGLRVSKGMGSEKNHVRLSIVGPSDLYHMNLKVAANGCAPKSFEYAQPFKYRWQGTYSLGEQNTYCKDPYFVSSPLKGNKDYVSSEGACLVRCNNDNTLSGNSCYSFSWSENKKVCALNGAQLCERTTEDGFELFEKKYLSNWLFSTLLAPDADSDAIQVRLTADKVANPQPVSLTFTVRSPTPKSPRTSGIIWSDPCVSSKWIKCELQSIGTSTALNRSVTLANAIFGQREVDRSPDFFYILGDNFYDQDGRLNNAVFDGLSFDVKTRLMAMVVGNHDAWVCGGPECGDEFDHAGYGMMQWYAQDVISSLQQNGTNLLYDFSIDPDKQSSYRQFNNNATNFIWYHTVGNVGFIGYSGAAKYSDSKQYFGQACNFMGANSGAEVLFLLGHWNSCGSGCSESMTVPNVYMTLSKMSGCDIFFKSGKFRFFDGHVHCNHVQNVGVNDKGSFGYTESPNTCSATAVASEAAPIEHGEVLDSLPSPPGFMIGAHGMHEGVLGIPCVPQFGFVYVDSVPGNYTRVWYFEERREGLLKVVDNYEAILACVEATGIQNCTGMAELWMEIKLDSGDDEKSRPVFNQKLDASVEKASRGDAVVVI